MTTESGRIVLAGGSGFLGQALCKGLIERGHQRARRFTSTDVARRLLDSIDELAQ